MAEKKPLRFNRVGKTYQLRIETAEDLQNVLALDDSLWMATSAPRDVFALDAKFLALADTDHDDRIHSNEVKEAIHWLLDALADWSLVQHGADTIPLSAIHPATPAGKRLLRAAGYVLEGLKETDEDTISLEQVRTYMATVLSRPLNGDGVIVPAAADPQTRPFVEDAIACTGGTEDAGGKLGIAAEHLDAFVAAIAGHIEWRDAGRIPDGRTTTDIMPLGADTPAAHAVMSRHADKLDLYFEQCGLVRFQSSAAAFTGWKRADLADVDFAESGPIREYLGNMPIAQPAGDAVLPLAGELINPAYRAWVAQLADSVLKPVLGGDTEGLSAADWQRVKSVLAPYAAYTAARKGAQVEALPTEKLTQYRDGPFADTVRELIQRDRKVTEKMDAAAELEKLLLYHQNLMELANNFVSFPHLYDPENRAVFEMGSAVLDGRWFNFAVRVDNVKAHSVILKEGKLFTLYLEVTSADTDETFHVAVPVTSGTKGNLSVGKRGVFFDTRGKQYGARVVQMVENPISLGEALAAPFVRMGQLVAGKIEKFSGAAEKGLQTKFDKGLKQTAAAPATAAAQPAPQAQQASDAGSRLRPGGMMLGAGVAFAALGSAFAYVTKTLAALKVYQVGLGLLGAVLVVLLPVTGMAIASLRKQDLSALLEGCGWAVNARMRLTRQQRRFFTRTSPYPEDAEGGPGPMWRRVLLIVITVVALLGCLYGIFRVGREFVLLQGEKAKAAEIERARRSGKPPAQKPGAVESAPQDAK